MMPTWSAVVLSSVSAAVLSTAFRSDSLISAAWPPMRCASSRIGTTSATTTSTTMMPIV